MKKMLGEVRQWVSSHKHVLVMIALLAAFAVIAGCTSSSGGSPPPSGPIGGGCG